VDTHLLAYLAGAIDSDGHITVQRTRKNVKANRCGPVIYYYPKFGLSQTEPIIPALLSETFGGRVYTHQPKNPKHKLWHVWQAGDVRAVSGLRLLLPYLRLKKEQAVLVIRLGEVMKKQWAEIKTSTKPPYRIPEAMNAIRHELWESVTRLNKPRNRRVHFTEPRPA